jgi:hypothetical protein
MSEIELVKNLVNSEKMKYDLELQIDALRESNDKTIFQSKLDELNSEIEMLKSQLKQVRDTSHSQNLKKAMIEQLGIYISELKNAKSGLRVIRNQGLILENYLFQSIANNIRRLLTSDYLGIYVPDLLYSYQVDGSIDTKELIDFLEVEVKILRELNSADYLDLRNYFDEFRNRVEERFIE